MSTTPLPAVYGQSDRPPRGDYVRQGNVAADYSCPQNYAAYTAQDHDTYKRLYQRQTALLSGLACDAFIEALPLMGESDEIPRFDQVNEKLHKATGWLIVAVPGLIPEFAFFSLLANQKFPVTDWIRTPAEFAYVVEPDVFHDLFGHVPLLFNPIFAKHLQAYGAGGIKAHRLGACELLSRLYWHTIEFGLIRQPNGLRAYGAGILSSSGELGHVIASTSTKRVDLNLLRAMQTSYKIDQYQSIYFVIDSFQQLYDMTTPDFTLLYEQLKVLKGPESK